MALQVQPPALGMQAQAPTLVQPVDLQPALDRLHNAFREGFINSQDIQKRTEVGITDAQAQRKQNEAAGAKAEQDRKDQEGGAGYTKPGLFSRLTGIGTGPKKPAAAPAPAAGAAPAPVTVAPALSGAAPTPGSLAWQQKEMTQNPSNPSIAFPSGPYSAAAAADDFNPAHESTDDLLNLAREGGYFFN